MTTPITPAKDFVEITQLIAAARVRAVQAVNTTLIDLYWQWAKSSANGLPRRSGGRGGGATGGTNSPGRSQIDSCSRTFHAL